MSPLDQVAASRRLRRMRTTLVIAAMTAVTVVAGALIAWWMAQPIRQGSPGILLGAPPTALILVAISVLILLFVGVALVEAASILPQAQPPAQIMSPFSTGAQGRARVTIVIPAHNEEANLPHTLHSLREQTRHADRIVVVADACTDSTAHVAREAGCLVLETRSNRGRKAGAINQALAVLLPTTGPGDVILIMDADTQLSRGFIEGAASRLEADGHLAAVGGVFIGDGRPGLLPQLQRNEFLRYARQISARRGRAFVLTGTATMFRASALEAVASNRHGLLPGTHGHVYDESSITEDNELTLALKTLGAHVLSPPDCRVTTETMPTPGSLWTQRMRWQRGALENLSDYGLRASTSRYWLQQWGLAYGTVALSTCLLALVAIPLITATWTLLPFWMAVALAFAIERTITAWEAGWKGRMLAFSLVPEIAYDLFLQACFARSLMSLPRSRRLPWGHLSTAEASEGAAS